MSTEYTKRLGATLALACAMIFLTLYGLQSQSSEALAERVVSTDDDSGNDFARRAEVVAPVSILVDDFRPQPYQGDSIYYYNRLGGDRGALQESDLDWGEGQVTATITAGHSWGGIWFSLNHPDHERQPINFSAVLPSQILPSYQSQITDLSVQVARGTSGRILKLELKDGNSIPWSRTTTLDGGHQTLNHDLPSLSDITQLVLVLDQAGAGDYIVVEQVSLTATTQITDVAQAAFVWSYGMLLNNWNPATGLVRDKAKDASDEFDAIQGTGALAAATAVAEQLGVIDRVSAVQVVNQISHTLLISVPRYHGLWPHWVVSSSTAMTIAQNTEWSSVDTAIAAISLLDAQSALGLDTSGTERMLEEINWDYLLTADGISHGYTYTGELITHTWDTFGGESWLVALAYAAAEHEVPPLKYGTPPTANGSGFIDELAWLLVLPPSVEDHWGADWASYRLSATYTQTSYYCTHYPTSCFCQLDLFGLSAAEVPVPSAVAEEDTYQAFGVGGRSSPPNDGSPLLGAPVVVPHYSAMVASLRPTETISMWNWMINQGPFSPLNNVESLMFPPGPTTCSASEMEWNQLKGSWNLALQTLGWGRYLAERQGQFPVLWRATLANPFLRNGYVLLVPNGLSIVHLPLVLKE